jgi:hypothetical protein
LKPTDRDGGVMIAVTFAEAGELETARRYAPPPGKGRVAAWIERHLLAAAFAEEGMHDEALRLSGAKPPRPPPGEDALEALLRARGVRMFSAVLSPAALVARR